MKIISILSEHCLCSNRNYHL